MTSVQTTFTVDGWEPVGDEPVGDGPDTGRAVLRKTYSGGDLTGVSTGQMLTTQGSAGASYVAQERVDGTLAGRRGTFVLEHGGSKDGDHDPVTWAAIVPGSGTGELAGLSGRGRLSHDTLDLDVELPAS